MPDPGQASLAEQYGLTLVELMISMALGLLIVMATTTLFVSTKTTYLMQDDDARIQETGRYAIDVITRSIRTVSFEEESSSELPISAAMTNASISGLDAAGLKSRTQGIDGPYTKAVNGSDVLAVRFSGAGSGDNGDGTMLNCAGFSVSALSASESADESRGWSIFYVAEDASGEPELYCKYRGDDSWTSQAIARGVESFQVLYGLDMDDDGLPDQFLNATAIDALDNASSSRDARLHDRVTERRGKGYWKKVAAVKFSLLIRGANRTQSEKATTQYDLFGKDYSNAYAGADAGVRLLESSLPKSVRGRQRRIFSSMVLLPTALAKNHT
ncbi:PilW family protein [Noviherbaspirillum sp.]|uniref:PilW family protein n=1 Tax=Noviherbaspirillum sp. TaxID=1926288 RepID=UPI002B47AAB2|nr:PilW family protein [Noviherbaspirillum sp.]HJV80081.1 PilW family protein [Noviherbaspirillum sp.]